MQDKSPKKMRNYKMLMLREKKGLSQQKLAEVCGVKRQTINGIEKGKFRPSYAVMIKICHALDAKCFDDVFELPKKVEEHEKD